MADPIDALRSDIVQIVRDVGEIKGTVKGIAAANDVAHTATANSVSGIETRVLRLEQGTASSSSVDELRRRVHAIDERTRFMDPTRDFAKEERQRQEHTQNVSHRAGVDAQRSLLKELANNGIVRAVALAALGGVSVWGAGKIGTPDEAPRRPQREVRQHEEYPEPRRRRLPAPPIEEYEEYP